MDNQKFPNLIQFYFIQFHRTDTNQLLLSLSIRPINQPTVRPNPMQSQRARYHQKFSNLAIKLFRALNNA